MHGLLIFDEKIKIFWNQPQELKWLGIWGKNCRAIKHKERDSANLNRVPEVIKKL